MPTDLNIDSARIPRHVAIVMDGNGRWAEKRSKPRLYGHKVGADSVREVVEIAGEIGVEVLTLYAFSSENWNRPDREVNGLMTILKNYLVSELQRMLKNDIRLTCLGELERLPESVRKVLTDVIDKTKHNNSLVLNLALSYGSRDEITHAVREIAEQCRLGQIDSKKISHQTVADHLYTAGLVDPDLLIRTGGEQRLSNFLLWQASYAEIVFSEIMWPDFRKDSFLDAVHEYQIRERRFGKIGAQLKTS